jgi:hypothetical protein
MAAGEHQWVLKAQDGVSGWQLWEDGKPPVVLGALVKDETSSVVRRDVKGRAMTNWKASILGPTGVAIGVGTYAGTDRAQAAVLGAVQALRAIIAERAA